MIEKKYRKLQIWMPFLLSLMVVLGMYAGFKLQHTSPAERFSEGRMLETSEYGILEELVRYIDAKYVDEVDHEELMDEVIMEILEDLDPHSNYISEKQLVEVKEQLEGGFDGIGVEFMVVDDTVVILKPLPEGPAETAGVLALDQIISIEDSVVAGKGLEIDDVMAMLKGKRGTEVRIGVRRDATPKLLDFTLKRDRIPIKSVDVGYMLTEDVGYIKLNRFSATTYREFMIILEDLVKKQNMKHLVIDLRHNPGGYLKEATNILSQFFEERGKLLVYTEGDNVQKTEYKTTGKTFFEVDKIAVLIDETSASASEIMAGALQDWDRAVIIGRRSFGKGLVQEQYPLRNGGALRLTVARYFIPSRRSIQKPYTDKKYQENMGDRHENGELINADSMVVNDTTTYKTAQGRIVYGGGGITPDIFIPADSNWWDTTFSKAREWIPNFVFRNSDKMLKGMEFQDVETYVQSYEIPATLMDDFFSYAIEQDSSLNYPWPDTAQANLLLLLKARLGKQLFHEEGFFRVTNEKDKMVEKALNALNAKNPLTFK